MNNGLQVFTGNSDQNTAAEHELHAPMRAKFVRWKPQSWDDYGIALRVEVTGCRHSGDLGTRRGM